MRSLHWQDAASCFLFHEVLVCAGYLHACQVCCLYYTGVLRHERVNVLHRVAVPEKVFPA